MYLNVAKEVRIPGKSNVIMSVPVTIPPNNNTPLVHLVKENGFQIVKNGVKPTRNRNFVPVNTYNHFQILQVDEENETQKIRLLGDSIIRGQLKDFCGHAPNKRKRFCMPGVGLDDINSPVSEATTGANNKDLFIIHVGTNDIQRTRSKKLLEKHRTMIQQHKNRTQNIIIPGILPRIEAQNEFYNKAFSINNKLESLCLQEGIVFLTMWNQFYDKPHLFADDGLHLNSVGSARFGRLLNNTVYTFW